MTGRHAEHHAEATARPRVLIVDDHSLFRAGVRQQLADFSEAVEVVGEAGDGEEAVALVASLRPDVVLMDISMPGMNGIEATRVIKRDQPRVAVLVLTVYDARQYVTALLDAGAAGYLLKNVEIDDLTRAILDVHAGESVLDPAVSRAVFGRYARPPAPEGPVCELSAREMEVLRLAAGGSANKQIAGALGVSVRTVHAHMRHILTKLGVGSRTEAVVHGLQNGWLELDDLP
ncbi:MAG: response regulator transcription factor [Thermoleophilia bacterium]